MSKKRIPKCSICGKLSDLYFTKYDAYACYQCNIWIEKICDDADCEYCKDRPEKPINSIKK